MKKKANARISPDKTTRVLARRIGQVRTKIKALKATLGTYEQELHELRTELSIHKYGIHPGALVRTKIGDVYRVHEIIPSAEPNTLPWVVGETTLTSKGITKMLFCDWEVI